MLAGQGSKMNKSYRCFVRCPGLLSLRATLVSSMRNSLTPGTGLSVFRLGRTTRLAVSVVSYGILRSTRGPNDSGE
jgi:hypothetical protein